MKFPLILLLIFQNVLSSTGQELNLEDIFLKNKYRQKSGQNTQFTKSSSNYTTIENDETFKYRIIESHNLNTNKSVQIFSDQLLKAYMKNEYATFNDYSFSNDNSYLLLSTDREYIYRRSIKANYFYHKIGSKQIKPLSENGKQLFPTFSPSNNHIAFIRDNDIYIKELFSEKEIQVTNDGKVNSIINGKSDWVYEEEFSLTRAYEWSPNGQYLLYLKFDETEVPEFSYIDYGYDLYPKVETFKYPKAGEKNAQLSLWLYDVESDKNIPVPIITDDSTYIPRIQWMPSGKSFSVMVVNRWQNHLAVLGINLHDFDTKVLYQEKNNQYIALPNIYTFLSDSTLVISSEKKGFNNVYLIKDKQERIIGNEHLDITSIYGIDKKQHKLYCQAFGKNISEKHIFQIDYITNKVKQLTEKKGNHLASFSVDFRFMKHTFSADGQPSVVTMKDLVEEKTVLTLEDNFELKREVEQFWNDKFFFSIPIDDYTLPAYIIKPKNFDESKKYPVLMFVYGGPGSQRVKNSWGGNKEIWFQYLVQQGFIVVSVDNRGTGGKGADFKKQTYLQLGKLETEDQISSAKFLIENYPYIKADQISIFGWSYGGFLSSLALFEGGETFKSAISIAPVTNWKYYDTIYTERYMRTQKANPSGYAYGPLFSAKKMKNDLLLVHGTSDDNVHFQNSVELIKELNNRGKNYELLIYPDKIHGIGGRNNQYHLYKSVTNFLFDRL